MSEFGMLCLGAFVGGLLTIGLQHTATLDNYKQVLATCLGAAVSGVVLVFIQFAVGKNAGPESTRLVLIYPIGLLLALMWHYSAIAMQKIRSSQRVENIVGWAHMIGLVITTGFVILIFLAPAARDAWQRAFP